MLPFRFTISEIALRFQRRMFNAEHSAAIFSCPFTMPSRPRGHRPGKNSQRTVYLRLTCGFWRRPRVHPLRQNLPYLFSIVATFVDSK